jgi:hypothetical protein
MPSGRRPFSIAFACAVVVMAAIAWAAVTRIPQYKWDVLAYSGVVLSYDTADAEAVHAGVYQALSAAPTSSSRDLPTAKPSRATREPSASSSRSTPSASSTAGPSGCSTGRG